MSTQDNCQPCAPVPTVPAAPPPTCPATSVCDEFVPSDCVVSTVDVDCTATFIPPNGDDAVVVGLVINEGTTLTNVYQQLTDTACIFNPSVLGAVLQTIGNNATLTQIFCDLVCACACDDGCADVIPVSIATYTSIDTDSFDINFLAQPNYKYEITINDSNATPFTFYTYNTPVAPNLTPNPIPFTINTSAFTKNVGGVITNPPPPTTLIAGHSHEIYINAVTSDGSSCPAGPWTVVLPEDPGCGTDCDFVNILVSGDPLNITNLEVIVNYLQGTVYPAFYQITVYNSNDVVVVPTGLFATTPSAPVDFLYPNITQNFNFLGVTTAGDYTVEVTPVCSTVPLCLGETSEAEIALAAAITCAPPDITNITVTSI